MVRQGLLTAGDEEMTEVNTISKRKQKFLRIAEMNAEKQVTMEIDMPGKGTELGRPSHL